ncbi:MAG: AAA family ATPase, partial [Bacteroidales bacterium]|nr:AAA family ATPase [Bacteroidales bacterium]
MPKNCKIIKEDANRFVVYSEKANSNYPKLYNLLHKENIKFEDGSKFVAEPHENMTFKISDNSIIGKRVVCNDVKFIIKDLKNNNKDQFWIQLEEFDETDDDIPGFSPLKYFFDDDISIKDDAGNEYSLFQGIESEYKLILKEKNNQNRFQNFCFPKGKILQVRVNTYQLRKQLEAVLTLQNMPVGEHSNLIKLFENRERVLWHEPNKINKLDWIVLTDDNRSGAKEQRNFVKQAIQTPDFAILEGPPGSGKTTVILELICQLAKQGQRILLCGSTHVAIDNVLERLHEKRNGEQTLIQKFNILPVRIGDENRINEDVKEFQIDNLIKDHQISQDLLLDVANLVCGTTIGILQHPHFKDRKQKSFFHKGERKTYFEEPIVPDFDYLIIDESSKTTFQEFLVPALYAKKWILAGDVMQLSPFTDREQIVANLESLQLKDGNPLPKEYQLAVFYLHKIIEIVKYAKNRFILPVPVKVIEAFFIEMGKRNFENLEIAIFNVNTTKLELIASNLIIIDENILKDNLNNLPETHAVLEPRLKIDWQTSEHAFIHNVWQNKGNNFKLRIKGKEMENSFDIVENTNQFLKEKSWAEEIAWRVDREHQLRLLSESKTQNYRKAIEELIPLSLDKKDIETRINTIATIAFPSILESLIKGIPARFKQTETTISKGFNQQELKHRRTVLTYQH